MFSKEVTNSDEFLDMPLTSQALYFHLWMNADDDWFVPPKSILRLSWARDDDLKVLITKWFVIEFRWSVIVITHWKTNNEIKKDRYKRTIYQEHLSVLGLDNGKYNMSPECLQNVSSLDTQVSIGKDSKGNISAKKKSSTLEETLPETFTDCPPPPVPAQQHDGTLGAKAHKLITTLWRDVTVQSVVSSLKKSLEKWSSSKNPPSSARPPKQAGIDKFGMSKALIDLCPSCDREPNFLLKRIEEWLALDTRENILTWYTNYCKKYWKSSQRPTTIIKNWEYKQYIEEKVKPSKLTKYEERLNNPTWRSHPTVDRQYKWLLDEEYEEYSALSMDYYWEVMQENKFIWYPL